MDDLERHQVWLYLAAVLAGLGLGSVAPDLGGLLAPAVWPALVVLLYATFTQVPFVRFRQALSDVRFIIAVVVGNFVLVPLLVWALLGLAPHDPAARLGVGLVLLMPCTDWFITFTHVAGGDTTRATAVTPINLIVQLLALPVYLWLLAGQSLVGPASGTRALAVFTAVVGIPLVAAWVTQRRSDRTGSRRLVERLGRLPVVVLAVVVFLVAASQVGTVATSTALLPRLLLVYGAFLVGAALLGRAIATVFALEPASARTLIFSLGTRNSFLVLPLALALPAGWEPAVVVIVFQSLVELSGMTAYVWVVPRMAPVVSPGRDRPRGRPLGRPRGRPRGRA